MVINPYIFKREPNTFIGGIAKLGGTGANAPILTAAELATTLGISESIIKGFKVVGEDVECRITEDYILKDYAFGHQSAVDANQNITSYIDADERCKGSGIRAFGNCNNITNIVLNGFIGSDIGTNGGVADRCINLINCELNSLEEIRGYYWFRSTKIKNFNLPKLSRIIYHTAPPGNVSSNFSNMSQLEVLSARKLKQICTDPSINYNNFEGIKLNATIEVHIDLATANSGDIDADLLYAYTSRNATINFYDDNGDFVETYNP